MSRLTSSNVEAVSVCCSESFEALAEGLEAALPAFGGVPATHRTDNLSAACPGSSAATGGVTSRWLDLALREHYGMSGSPNHPGVSHQNGDVESAHHQFKCALDQRLTGARPSRLRRPPCLRAIPRRGG
jgi:transposase InsO family protein